MNIFVHLVLLLCLPPLIPGIINKTKAAVGGRRGPPLLQPYYDLFKLLRKDLVISHTVTWVFAAAPVVALVSAFAAGIMLPLGGLPPPVSFTGDWILFAYLFALGRFFTAAAALDTGSSFEGMGAAREVTFACLAEPALIFAVLALAGLSGQFTLSASLTTTLTGGISLHVASLALTAAGLFIYILAENCRIPVDDPTTHLELTMIHEVMVLDHSGPLFGIIHYGSALKLFVTGALLLQVVVPFQHLAPVAATALFCLGMFAIAVIVGLVESSMARLQLPTVPHLLMAATILCGFGFILGVRTV